MQALTGIVGRVLFAVPFALFGLNHLMKLQVMKGYVPTWIPGAPFWVGLTGVALIAAAVAIIANRYAKLASFGLALFLLVVTLTIHVPGMSSADAALAQANMTAVLKNTALLGAALTFAGILRDKPEPTV